MPAATNILSCPSRAPAFVLLAASAVFIAVAVGLLGRVLVDAALPVEVHDVTDHRRTFVTWVAIVLGAPGVFSVLEALPQIGIVMRPASPLLLLDMSAVAAGVMLLLRGVLRLWVPLTAHYDESEPYYQGIRNYLNESQEIPMETEYFSSYAADVAMQKTSRGIGSAFVYGGIILTWAIFALTGADCGT